MKNTKTRLIDAEKLYLEATERYEDADDFLRLIKNQPDLWHRLQDNQNDLPEHEDKVLVITEAKGGKRNYVLAYYCHDLHTWASGMNRNVIAWMELPHFI